MSHSYQMSGRSGNHVDFFIRSGEFFFQNAHSNICTSDLNAWVNIFKEFAEAMGMEVDMNKLFGTLYNKALEGDPDCADFCPTVISQVSI